MSNPNNNNPHNPFTQNPPTTHEQYAPPAGPPPQQQFYQPNDTQQQQQQHYQQHDPQQQQYQQHDTQQSYSTPHHQNQQQPYSTPHSHHQQNQPQQSTEAVLASLPDRGEQYETMQNYESHAHVTDADRDQEVLQREFPSVDSTLIAALYGDSGSVSATREMLQALGDGK